MERYVVHFILYEQSCSRHARLKSYSSKQRTHTPPPRRTITPTPPRPYNGRATDDDVTAFAIYHQFILELKRGAPYQVPNSMVARSVKSIGIGVNGAPENPGRPTRVVMFS